VASFLRVSAKKIKIVSGSDVKVVAVRPAGMFIVADDAAAERA